MSCEHILQIVFSGIEGKISHKQFIIHNDFLLSSSLFPDCSRLSGLKSSLNGVHLRICHYLESNKLSNRCCTLHHPKEIANYIRNYFPPLRHPVPEGLLTIARQFSAGSQTAAVECRRHG
jgi:hypothetical protein